MNEGLEIDFDTLFDLEDQRLRTEEELHEDDYFDFDNLGDD